MLHLREKSSLLSFRIVTWFTLELDPNWHPRPAGLAPLPKIEHLHFWWQPSFYPAFYFKFVIAYLYFLIFLFSISFFNYNWKTTILIVYLILICIYSIILIFSHLSLITILNKICFYPFRSSHWEIFYKIATSVLH